MPETKYKQTTFGALAVGDEFTVYGDESLNYNYPKICRCIKDSDDTAHEIDGISFLIGPSDNVAVEVPA